MKSVFIIAIVAVAMIGVMVPSAFADRFDGVNLSQLELTLQESSLVESTDANILMIELKAKNNSDNEISGYVMHPYLNSGSAVYKPSYTYELKEYGVSSGTCPSDPTIPAGLSKNMILCFIIPKDHSYPFTLYFYDNDKSYCGACEYCTCTSTNLSITNTVSNIPIVESIPEPTNSSVPEPAGIASFVDQTKDPQHYIDRYNNEPTYKQWFDENYSQYDSIEQAVGYDEWSSSGSFSIDKQEYHLGKKIFITANLLPEDNGTVQFLRPISDTRHEVYIQIPFDGMAKSQFNYYFEPKYDESKGICSIDDIAGNWIVKFSGTPYEDINFKILDQTASWDDRSFEPLEKNGQCAVDTHIPTEIKCGTGTELVNGICQVVQTTTTETSDGGGCLIATATYGSELAPQVQQLRELRDNQLLNTASGTQFMGTFNDIYYSFSPIVADYERENPYFKEAIKLAITPMLTSLSLMENVNSESEVLGMGLSVIMLNIGCILEFQL